MSNIYEALEQAQREKTASGATSPISYPVAETATKIAFPRKCANKTIDFSMEKEMISLYHNIENLLPHVPQKMIQFIGSRGGEGVSTIVREFARMATGRLDMKVLIMDAAHHNPTQHIHFNVVQGKSWLDVMGKGENCENACHGTDEANLFLSTMLPQPAMTAKFWDRSVIDGFLNELKSRFDLILVDSSPAATSLESLALSRHADGVILVVEAEKTRWPVVESVKEKIVKSGGNLLGVVFNKRMHYIPEYIYRRL